MAISTPFVRKASCKGNRQKKKMGEKAMLGPGPVLACTSRRYVASLTWKQDGERKYADRWLGGLKKEKDKECAAEYMACSPQKIIEDIYPFAAVDWRLIGDRNQCGWLSVRSHPRTINGTINDVPSLVKCAMVPACNGHACRRSSGT